MSKAVVQNVQMVGLYVQDFDAALSFYRDLLRIPLTVDAHGNYHHADFSFPKPYFHFALFPAGRDSTQRPVHVTFLVDDCREVFNRLRETGIEIVREPESVGYSGGGISCTVLDPDKNYIELFQSNSNT